MTSQIILAACPLACLVCYLAGYRQARRSNIVRIRQMRRELGERYAAIVGGK